MQITSKPITDDYAHWAPLLPGMTLDNLKNLHRDMIDCGPRQLVVAIEAEFRERGINPYTMQPTIGGRRTRS